MVSASAVTPNYRGEPEQEALLHLTRLFPPRKEAGHVRLGHGIVEGRGVEITNSHGVMGIFKDHGEGHMVMEGHGDHKVSRSHEGSWGHKGHRLQGHGVTL